MLSSKEVIIDNTTENFFKTVRDPFPPVKNGKIDTIPFLKASKNVVEIVDRLGKVFAPVKYDLNNNIEKLTKQYNTNKLKNETLQDMILAEKNSGGNFATISLLWLMRSIYLMELLLEKIIESEKDENFSENMKNELTDAYNISLKPFHGWLNQKAFALICRMCPSKTVFLNALGYNNNLKEFCKDSNIFLRALRENRIEINNFYTIHNLQNNDIV